MYYESGFDADLLETMLRGQRLAAAARAVVELSSARPVAVQLVAAQPGTFIDAITVTSILRAVRVEVGPPTGPMLFAVDLAALADLPEARSYSEHPLLVSVDADQLLERPSHALSLIRIARGRGWEIGLDGVGRTPRSVLAGSVVEPALITLDPAVLRNTDAALTMETVQTLNALVQTTGAAVLADDVDDDLLRDAAVSLGATLARGAAVRPGQVHLPPELDYTLDLFDSPPLPDPTVGIFDLAAQRYRPHRAPKPILVGLSQQIESVARSAGRSTLVFASFQQSRQVTPYTRRRYDRLVTSGSTVVVAARGLRQVVPGALTVNLDRRDPLIDEWVVLVLGPTASILLAASDRKTPTSRDRDRNFDYILSYDRDLAAHAARSALLHL